MKQQITFNNYINASNYLIHTLKLYSHWNTYSLNQWLKDGNPPDNLLLPSKYVYINNDKYNVLNVESIHKCVKCGRIYFLSDIDINLLYYFHFYLIIEFYVFELNECMITLELLGICNKCCIYKTLHVYLLKELTITYTSRIVTYKCNILAILSHFYKKPLFDKYIMDLICKFLFIKNK